MGGDPGKAIPTGRRVYGSLGVIALGHIGFTAVSSLLAVLSARWLGPSDRGALMLVVSSANLAALLAFGGIGVHVRSVLARGGTIQLRQHADIALRFGAIAFVLSLVAVAVVRLVVGTQPAIVWLSLVLLAVTQGVSLYLRDVLIGTGRAPMGSLVFTIAPLVQLVLVLVLEAIGRLSLTTSCAACLVGSTAVLLFLLVLLRDGASLEKPDVSAPAGDPYLLSSVLATPMAARSQLLSTVERVTLGLLSGPADVATYGVAATYIGFGGVMAIGGSQLTQHAAGRRDDDRARFITGFTMALTAIIVSVLTLASPVAVAWLFGDDYSAAVPLVAILAPGVAASTLVSLRLGSLAGDGRYGSGSGLAIGQTVLLIALQVALIGAFGLVGAAVASLVSSLGFAMIALRSGSRRRRGQ